MHPNPFLAIFSGPNQTVEKQEVAVPQGFFVVPVERIELPTFGLQKRLVYRQCGIHPLTRPLQPAACLGRSWDQKLDMQTSTSEPPPAAPRSNLRRRRAHNLSPKFSYFELGPTTNAGGRHGVACQNMPLISDRFKVLAVFQSEQKSKRRNDGQF